MKKYCSKCGHPTEYALNKPKYCEKCKNPFESLLGMDNFKTSNSTRIEKPIRKIEFELDEDDTRYDDGEINIDLAKDIKSLEFEEIHIPKQQKETIGSIINSVDKEAIAKTKKRNKRVPKKEAKEKLKEILSEGKTLRPKK
jgi:hypothetical protein